MFSTNDAHVVWSIRAKRSGYVMRMSVCMGVYFGMNGEEKDHSGRTVIFWTVHTIEEKSDSDLPISG